VNDDTVPGATVVLEGPVQTDPRTVVTNGNRFFEFKDVEPGTTYHVTVSAQGFANWTSPAVILKPGQYAILTGSKLHIAEALTTITVAAPVASPEEMAAEQVKAEEQQRIFGIIPNFYIVYDHDDAAPLTTKLNSSSPPMSFSIRLPSSTLPRLPASTRRQTTPTTARVRRVMLIAFARAMPTALSTSWSGALSYHRFCTRTALLLPGLGHKQVTRSARTLQPIHLQGRQRTAADNRVTRPLPECLWRRFTLRTQLSPDRRGEIPPGTARLDSHSLSKPPTHL
jgi:hypothetical protein